MRGLGKAGLALTVWIPWAAFGQPARPAFEAASVKPSQARDNSSSWNSSTGYLVIRNQSLKALIRIAYGVRDDQIAGGPKWIDSERFDVDARSAGPAKDPELLEMLQTLLADRFQLAFHRETKTVTGYALVAAKGGLKVRPDAKQGRGSMTEQGKFVAWGISMSRVAERISRILASPVTDRTGAAGFYSFTLEWTPDSARPPDGTTAPPDALSDPSLFGALQQQLGLKLEADKESMEVLAIDRARRPSEN